jgi:hypothetical protein
MDDDVVGARMQRRKSGQPYKIGTYGAGTLFGMSNRDGLFILFNDTSIARRLPGERKKETWIALDRAWKVTPLEDRELWVQHNNGEGVFVSLGGGMK